MTIGSPSRKESTADGAQRPPAEGRATPFTAEPVPLAEYFDSLKGDYGKVARRLLRACRWEPGVTENGIFLDAGEALISYRSEKLWGDLRLDRKVTAAGRRQLVRRVIERLDRDGWISTRPAHPSSPSSGPPPNAKSGPPPTIVRFTQYRAILWPKTKDVAHPPPPTTAQVSAQGDGPIPPATAPTPPVKATDGGEKEGAPAVSAHYTVGAPAPAPARSRQAPRPDLDRCGIDAMVLLAEWAALWENITMDLYPERKEDKEAAEWLTRRIPALEQRITRKDVRIRMERFLRTQAEFNPGTGNTFVGMGLRTDFRWPTFAKFADAFDRLGGK